MRHLNQPLFATADATGALTSKTLYGRYLQKWTFSGGFTGWTSGSGVLTIQTNDDVVVQTMRSPADSKWVPVVTPPLTLMASGESTFGPMEIVSEFVRVVYAPTGGDVPSAGTTITLDVSATGLT